MVDGSGAGTYTDLASVFRDHTSVWLAVRVGSEDLTPRTRIVGSAYALNASNLDGKAPSSFLDTSTTSQSKSGPLSLVLSSGVGTAISGDAPSIGGYFRDSDGSGYAYVGYGNLGIEAYGSNTGGFFGDNNSSGVAYVGCSDRGIWGKGISQVARSRTPTT